MTFCFVNFMSSSVVLDNLRLQGRLMYTAPANMPGLLFRRGRSVMLKYTELFPFTQFSSGPGSNVLKHFHNLSVHSTRGYRISFNFESLFLYGNSDISQFFANNFNSKAPLEKKLWHFEINIP